MSLNRACFLDRDSTLVRSCEIEESGSVMRGPRTVEEIEYLPGVKEACSKIRDAGILTIMVSNQPDVGKMRKSLDDEYEICDKIVKDLCLSSTYTCYHREQDGCSCRKPKPGMIMAAAYFHGIDLAKSVFVGDSWRDVEAGRSAGCTPYKVYPNEGLEAFLEWFLKRLESQDED